MTMRVPSAIVANDDFASSDDLSLIRLAFELPETRLLEVVRIVESGKACDILILGLILRIFSARFFSDEIVVLTSMISA